MSAASNDSIENIDFGGRFARQFFNNNWPSIEGDAHSLHIPLNPTTSTPVASDNSICESGYESFGQAHRKSSTSPTNSFQHGSIDINNNTCCTTSAINHSNTSSNEIITTSKHQNTSQHNTGNNVIQGSIASRTSSSAMTPSLTTYTITQNSIDSNAPNKTTNSNNKTNSSSLTADELAKLSAGIGLMKLIMTPDIVVRQHRSNSLFTTTPAVASSLSATNPWSSQDVYQRFNNVDKIERAASLHRTAASYSEPQYTWSGQLPSRSYKNPVYSCKVFLGGVPWDVTEQGLIETFGRFGPLRVQWPGKDVRQQSGQTKAGYVYLIYESERYVKSLLQACTQDFGAGSHPEKYYYQLSSRRMRFKEVQVIPWVLADSNYIRNQSARPDMHRTIFVGALHGMLTAEGLAKIMNDLFSGVAYVGIDSDKYKYPIGSGRVTFISQRSYMKAVSAAFVEVKSSQFCKKIQLDPYLESSQCSTCHIQSGPIFCRDCLRYFCKTCWNWHHSAESVVGRQHRPLMRKKRET